MHGQGRAEYKARQRDETISAGLSQKARQWHTLTSELLSQRQSQNSENPSLLDNIRLTEKLLTVNPDPIYLWNCRRETILQISTLNISESSPITFLQDERSLTASCLKRNPKAYGAWFHRKWCIRQYILLETKEYVLNMKPVTLFDDSGRLDLFRRWKGILNQELDLCSEFLQYDERNFHCWNYRRFIVAATATVLALMSSGTVDLWSQEHNIMKTLEQKLDGSWWWRSPTMPALPIYFTPSVPGSQISPTNKEFACTENESDEFLIILLGQDEKEIIDKEWKFTEEKINQNFSNGSAFHYRSILLQFMLENQCPPSDSSLSDNRDKAIEKRNYKKLELIANELDTVHSAFFTEPDDQTPWWYYRFLIKWAFSAINIKDMDPTKAGTTDFIYLDSIKSLLHNECNVINDLIETENNCCKWGYLSLHFVLKTLATLEKNSDEKRTVWVAEAYKCLDRLKDIDPDRSRRYECLMQMLDQ